MWREGGAGRDERWDAGRGNGTGDGGEKIAECGDGEGGRGRRRRTGYAWLRMMEVRMRVLLRR